MCDQGNEIILIFLLKNLRRCVGFMRRYSRLAKPPCQTRFLACSNPIARNLQTQKSHPKMVAFCVCGRGDEIVLRLRSRRSSRIAYGDRHTSVWLALTHRTRFLLVFKPAAQKQYKKTPPEKVAFFYIGRPHSI